ncbi:HAD family phosphatase [Rhodospirillaceae bacterium KN72]|uniref:HAD family phosphatase n=1 Tax=Pacificispira spongiicola TaxID=2729598 RepID=A0A7Y0HH76_9PROT|nr:HAD family phosphatase [Pacificispira spongiicola]NMM46418.1 HAD family phosphatase [Pacificispira spongiicola]
MTIDTFLFDIGEVLVDWNPDHLLRKLLPDDGAIRAFRQEAVTQQRILNMDRGQSWDEQWAEIEAHAPHHLDTAREYGMRWVETIAGPVQGSVDILTDLQARGFPTYALSNYGAENFERTVAVYPYLDTFDGRVVSGYEGVIKPEPEIYQLVIDRFKIDPARTLFIDDRPENTKAAEAFGFQTHIFTTPERLADHIAALNLDR